MKREHALRLFSLNNLAIKSDLRRISEQHDINIGRKALTVQGIVEADETFIRKSAKGSKRLVGRAARKRGTPAKAGLSSDDYAPVLIVRDRHGATTDQVMPDLEGATFTRVLKPVLAPDALLVSDGRAAYGAFAEDAGLLHIALNATAGERVYGSYHIQNVNAYISRLKHWLAASRVSPRTTFRAIGMAPHDRARRRGAVTTVIAFRGESGTRLLSAISGAIAS